MATIGEIQKQLVKSGDGYALDMLDAISKRAYGIADAMLAERRA